MRKILPVDGPKVGILGGSFNPPHIGHLNISLKAIKKFNLSRIIWMVTPCSPMKDKSIYDDLEIRVEKCKRITSDYSNKIKVVDIEKNFRNFYSSDSINQIKKWHRKTEFYWIIGCDNLLHIDKWQKWKMIFEMTKVIVCERTSMGLKANNTRASFNFKPSHIKNLDITHDSGFSILHIKKVNISSTEIRAKS